MEIFSLVLILIAVFCVSIIKPALSYLKLRNIFLSFFRGREHFSNIKLLAIIVRERLYKVFLSMILKRRNTSYLFNEIGNVLLQAFNADGFSVIITPESKRWYYTAWSNLYDKMALDKIAEELMSHKNTNIEMVLKRKNVTFINDTIKFGNWLGENDPVRSWLGIPIMIQGKVIGVISIDWFEKKKVKKWMVEVAKEIVEDITYIVGSFEQILKLVSEPNADPTLGILNVNALMEELTKASQEGKRFGLMFIKINNFRKISQIYGHSIAIEALKKAYKRISEATENRGRVFRVGSNEFAILFENPMPGAMMNYERRISNSFLRIINVSKEGKHAFVKLDLSIGLALCPKDGNDPESILEVARNRAEGIQT